MSALRDAAQQALEALEDAEAGHAAQILRAALAEQPAEQEPVAWQWLDSHIFRKHLPKNAEPGAWRPVYTAPSHAATRRAIVRAVAEIGEYEMITKLVRKLFTTRCCECGEVHVWFWQRRCSFCDKGEGEVK